MYVTECCFHVYLLTLKLNLICDITTSLETNPGPVYNLHQCNVETWNLQSENTENILFSVIGDLLCPAVKYLYIHRFCILYDDEGVDVIKIF